MIHLKNEVYHHGIDTDAAFILKTKHAMENIAFLADTNLILPKDGNLLKTVYYFSLEINGGSLRNAIPRESTAYRIKTVP